MFTVELTSRSKETDDASVDGKNGHQFCRGFFFETAA